MTSLTVRAHPSQAIALVAASAPVARNAAIYIVNFNHFIRITAGPNIISFPGLVSIEQLYADIGEFACAFACSLYVCSNQCFPGTTLGICDLKMEEWMDEAGTGVNPPHSSHADDAVDGQQQQRHLDDDHNDAQHDVAHTVCPPPAPAFKTPSPCPVLRVMVDGEWVPLKVE